MIFHNIPTSNLHPENKLYSDIAYKLSKIDFTYHNIDMSAPSYAVCLDLLD